MKIKHKLNLLFYVLLGSFCLQITKDLESYSKYLKKLKITAVYGGANIQTQIRSLNSGSQIVVGTPGRVIDLIKRKKLKLKDVEFVVLDEADEMLIWVLRKTLTQSSQKLLRKNKLFYFLHNAKRSSKNY